MGIRELSLLMGAVYSQVSGDDGASAPPAGSKPAGPAPDQFLDLGPSSSTHSGAAVRSLPGTFFSSLEINDARREENYDRFVGEGVQAVMSNIETGSDRGLVVTPVGLRDIAEGLIHRLASRPHSGPVQEKLAEKDILIVVQGKENMERWRSRLETLSRGKRTLGVHEQDTWEIGGVKVHIASIHSLSRRDNIKIVREQLSRSGLIILDKEHHIRPIEDSKGDDRNRFYRILVEAGFLGEDFKPRSVDGKYLLGMTETVSEGARDIYGGEKGLVYSKTIREMLSEGIIRRPDARVVVPEGSSAQKSVSTIWAEMSMEERVVSIEEMVQSLNGELGKDGKLPRIAIYAESREEAKELAEQLEKKYPERIALMISGSPEDEKRRTEDERDFFGLGIKDIVIHVETLVEGVEVFTRDPLDAVIFAGVSRAGAERYAMQSVAPHISAKKPPALVDMSGIFERHPDLTEFDPSVYVLNEGRVKKGSPLKDHTEARMRRAAADLATAQPVDIMTVDIFGENVGKRLPSYLKRLPDINVAALALHMNWSEGLARELLHGRYLPVSRMVIEEIGRYLHLDEKGIKELLGQWALDREEIYTRRNPVPKESSYGERVVLRSVRRGLVEYFGGNVNLIEGTQKETIQNYLANGTMLTRSDHRIDFINVLSGIIFGNGNEEKGLEYIERHLGKKATGRYWRPRYLSELSSVTLKNIEELFEVVEGETGRAINEIVWQMRYNRGKLMNPTPYRIGDEKEDYNCAILRIARDGTGFKIVAVQGVGASIIIENLRESELAKSGGLKIRSDRWIGLRMLEPTDLKDMEREDVECLFLEVEKAHGQRLDEIVWQMRYHQGKLLNPTPYHIGDEKKYDKCATFRIARDGTGFRIITARGTGASTIIENLRESELAKSGGLKIRSDGWIGLRPLELVDLKDMEREDVERLFSEVDKKAGKQIDEIVWQIYYQRGKLMNPTPYRIGDEKEDYNYAILRIARDGMGFKIITARRKGASAIIENLRGSNLIKSGTLTIAEDVMVRKSARSQKHDAERGYLDLGPFVRVGREAVDVAEKSALHAGAGAIPFAFGRLFTDILFDREHPSFKEFVKEYGALAVGGGVSRVAVDGVFNTLDGAGFFNSSPLVSRPTTLSRGLIRRSVPLFAALALAELVKDGKVDWERLPQSIGNIVAAGSITHLTGRTLLKSRWIAKTAEALNIVKRAGLIFGAETLGTTIIGACIASALEFTLLEVFGGLEQEALQKMNEADCRWRYAEAIRKNNILMISMKRGEDVDMRDVLESSLDLFMRENEYRAVLGLRVVRLEEERREKAEEIEREYMEACASVAKGSWVIPFYRADKIAKLDELEKEYSSKTAAIVNGGEETSEIPMVLPSARLSMIDKIEIGLHELVGGNAHWKEVDRRRCDIVSKLSEVVPKNITDFEGLAEEYNERVNAFWEEKAEEIYLADGSS